MTDSRLDNMPILWAIWLELAPALGILTLAIVAAIACAIIVDSLIRKHF